MSVQKRRPAAGLVAALACILIPASDAFAETSLTDPAGDAAGAADITRIDVSNDASGTVSFRITTSSPLTDAEEIVVFLDADRNRSTGPGGTERLVGVSLGSVFSESWNGTDWVDSPLASLRGSVSGTTAELSLARSDIGNASEFGFDVGSILFDGSGKPLNWDLAPDGGTWTYQLTFAQCGNGRDDDADGTVDGKDLGCSSPTDDLESDDPVTLRAGTVTVSPARPKAGAAVVVSAPVTHVERGLAVASGTATCVARVGGKAIKGAARIAGGRAICRLVVPLSARGSTVRGSISATYRGTRVAIPFAFGVS